MIKVRIAHLLDDDAADDFAINFFTDAAICAIERWLLDKDCIPTKEFVSKLKRLIQGSATAIYREMEHT